MNDPYQTLGVGRDATLSEIKQAYRRLAKELHPDRNPEDEQAADRFKDVSAAYDVLTDPEKRAHYERAAHGMWGGGFGGFSGPRDEWGEDIFDASFGTGDRAEDLFGDIAGNRRGRGGTSMMIPGEDMALDLEVDFVEAAVGAVKSLTLLTQAEVEVAVPPGIRDGEMIAIAGNGFPGMGGAPPGDLNVIVSIAPHPVLSRDVFDVRMDLAVTATQARRGARVMVPSIAGDQGVKIPPGAKAGDEVRLQRMGFRDDVSGRRGDQIVTLEIKPARRRKK